MLVEFKFKGTFMYYVFFISHKTILKTIRRKKNNYCFIIEIF